MTQREEIMHLKREANHAKTGLIDLLRRMEQVSRPQAAKLEKIIVRLEVWQNS